MTEIQALTAEVRKLRAAIERNQQALLNGRDAALYLGYGHNTFYRLVAEGVIPQTQLDPDTAPRYARAALDALIQQKTGGNANA